MRDSTWRQAQRPRTEEGLRAKAGLVSAPVHKDCKTPAGRSIRRAVSTGILVGEAEIMALAAVSFAVTLHWAFFAGRRAQRRLADVTTPLENGRWSAKTFEAAGCLGRIYSPIASSNRPSKK